MKKTKVFILGGSGYLGKAIYEALRKLDNFSVSGTYYENKPKWADDGAFSYFNANTLSLDDDLIEKIKQADFVINLMSTSKKEHSKRVHLEMPLEIYTLVSKEGNTFIGFDKRVNKYTTKNQSPLEEDMSNTISKNGVIVSLAPVLSKESTQIGLIKSLLQYKLTPIMGEGSNKINAIHKTDFSHAITALLISKIKSGQFYLSGSNSMTVRHLFHLTALEFNKSSPLFISINEKFFKKYIKAIEGLFEIASLNPITEIFGYDFEKKGENLASCLKLKMLSFDARVKRDGM